jgi:hypothetical protein
MLVQADSRQPLQGHTKDGKVCVEVESEAEFYICVQRTNLAIAKDVVFELRVDGQKMGHQLP